MDQIFQEGFQSDPCWYETDPVNQSAFVPYLSRPGSKIRADISGNGSNSSANMNKRMMEFLRRSWHLRSGTEESESNRCYRHMMNERSRREREKKGYLALHSLLPPGTKNDKTSIIQIAVGQIQELTRCKEVLERRNHELEAKLASVANGNAGSTMIRLKVADPTCRTNSMLEVLKCLKRMGSEGRSIQARLSDQELLAVIGIETRMEAAEVENVIHRTLLEVERQLRSRFPEG